MTARLSLLFSYDKDRQIFDYSLLCIYTICSKKVSRVCNTGVGASFLVVGTMKGLILIGSETLRVFRGAFFEEEVFTFLD